MVRKLIVNTNPHETRVALLENGTVVEFFIERMGDLDMAGNIYKGLVRRVLPGMQAAFIDIGLEQAAFIHVNDVVGPENSVMNKLLTGQSDSENNLNGSIPQTFRPDPPRAIGDVLKEGQEIMVDVAKSPVGTKGPRVTTYISIPGRYLVMMPFSPHIGVSRKIVDQSERDRLRDLIADIGPQEAGWIVRTVGEGVSREKLEDEMAFLRSLWKSVQDKFQAVSAPRLLHKELNVALRAVRDLLTNEAEALITDSSKVYNSILSFLDIHMPPLKSSVSLYTGDEPIFDAYNLEGEISRALKRKVWLKSGGYVVIDQTEALCAIDVNTGRYVGRHNQDETILKTNLEAAREIAYQIRLRDISGIIIIDFIDMVKKSHQEKIYNTLQEMLGKDRSKTHVLPISELGLVQMTRKRVRQSLHGVMSEPCFYCDGEGYLSSRQTLCYKIYRDALTYSRDFADTRVTIKVNPEIADLLHHEEHQMIMDLEDRLQKQVIIYPQNDYHLEQFEIVESAQSGDYRPQ